MANDMAIARNQACEHCGMPVISESDHIACMGFCDQVTHIKCAKLNDQFVKYIQERSNVFWTCKQCAHLMNLARFKTVMSSIGSALSTITESHGEKITEIKRAISDNGKKMELLSRKVTASTPLSSRSAEGQPAQKRRREENVKESKPLVGGTKTSIANDVLTVPPPKELFWLYLSRIHPSVKPEAVMKLAKDNLQCDDPIHVVSLIKKNADLSSLNFISFKIGLDVKYRDVALDPATWPHGILFREFEGGNTKNYWAPPDIRTSSSTPYIQVTPVLPVSSQSSNFLSPTSDMGTIPIASS